MTNTKSQSEDQTMLGFQDHEEVNVVPNSELLLVIIVTVVDQIVTWFLMDKESSCNVLYTNTLEHLRLRQLDLSQYNSGSLLAFNDFITHPCWMADLELSLEKRESEIKVILSYQVVSSRLLSAASMTSPSWKN